ncbi:helix-turn-helix domain-containing protein [Fibrella sp. HMF5335]|uniref:Helix-turn-helix domain-containing protein n=1 Tax=Fibrella rubiginis TaxID=2817060 RepID=A0A939GEI6_9BACT|nr:helix-turn-helix domain-containing protein [Fibrella rubiginis]MBO0935087.1 helix-turn-helix domain-containing protein [Fibrella rubiginis]
MTTEQIELAQDLQDEGYSFREIAKELGVAKSTVERALKQAIGTTDEEEDEEAIIPATLPQVRQAAPEANLAVHALMADLYRQREVRQIETDRIDNRKQWFVDKVNRLIKELIKNAGRTTWDEGEVDDYILRVDTLKEKLLKFCEKHAIDEEGLQLWAVLTELVNFMTAHMKENRPWLGSEVTFNLSKEAIRSWKDNMVDEFDQEAYEADEDEEDEDEEDEEDEDEEDD